MEYKKPDVAFEQAIKEGRLSVDSRAKNYAGHYMYMGTENGKDLFKNSMTRRYDV